MPVVWTADYRCPKCHSERTEVEHTFQSLCWLRCNVCGHRFTVDTPEPEPEGTSQ